MPETAISIKGLKKKYPEKKQEGKKTQAVEALRGIDLEIKKGEFFGLLGPNGAGKTTLINILTGISDKDKGVVEIFGKNIDTNRVETKQHIGISPQEFDFDVWLSVGQMLDYHAAYYGVPKQLREERAEEFLKMFGLNGREKADVRSLSG